MSESQFLKVSILGLFSSLLGCREADKVGERELRLALFRALVTGYMRDGGSL